VIRRATEFFTEILYKRQESFKFCMTTGPKKSYRILHRRQKSLKICMTMQLKSYRILHTNSSQETEVLEDLHG